MIMDHKMGLYGEYFEAIKEGKKKVEVRLNDEKRREISVGDIIEFTKLPEQDDKIQVEVTELEEYATFQEMYEEIPFTAFGCEGWSMAEMLKGTYEIFSKKQEDTWGTLAIRVDLL
jgi:ASC-1-like (ASCH) protein